MSSATQSKSGYDQDGFDPDGFDRAGLNARGFNRKGLHKTGGIRDPEGFDTDGFDKDGFDRAGLNDRGFNRQGLHKTGGIRDPDGYNKDQLYIGKWECCGNPKLKKDNPTPRRHPVAGKNAQGHCDEHNHVSCIGDANGCKRLFDNGSERPDRITPFSHTNSKNWTPGQ